MRPMQGNESEETKRGRSRRKGSYQKTAENTKVDGKRTAIAVGCTVLGLFIMAGAVYTYMGQKYKTVFFPNTTINGMDASKKSIEEIKEMIAAGVNGYTLTLETRGGGQEVLAGTSFDLHPEYDGTLEELLKAQKPFRWGIDGRKQKDYTIETMAAYDHQKLDEALAGLSCMDSSNMTEPADARLSDYIEGIGYQILPEEQGNQIRPAVLKQGVEEAILSLADRLVLEELDVYEKPQITADDPDLIKKAAAWNQIVQSSVTYRFGSRSEVLNGSTIHQWLYDDGRGNAVLDEAQVTEYVKQLAKKYNTAYQPKELKTSYGKTVKITGGPYGWRIHQASEVQALKEILYSGQNTTREPEYSQRGASHDGPDYGNTYVEINLTAQHLYFYKDGKLLVETDFVSGNASKGWSTPAGAYPLTYKQRNATLKGENYATPVSYWMPFNGNIGMHDAGWRSSFGGTLYKTGGSHGCVNLPPSAAKTIYENIEAGMPVLCYNLEGTEQKTSGGNKPAETKPAETAPAETKPAETKPAETAPAETKPSGGAVSQPGGETQSGGPSGGAVSAPGSGSGQTGSQPSSGVVSGPGQ